MSTPAAAATHLGTLTHERASASTIPWSIYAVLFASTSVVLGVMWDISWHRSIGRDTFWTPAHLAIYLGGVVSGLTCGWVALKTTFAGSNDELGASVRFWGFRAPLGAWVCIWGAFAMVTSAPFDDWWHNAYGLDVKIISPPHMLLAAGIAAIQCGAMLMALGCQNRAAGDRRLLGRLYLSRRGPSGPARGHRGHRIHPALGHAPVALLQSVGRRVRVLPREHRARVDFALAGDDHGAHLCRPDALHAVSAAALSGTAAARTDLRARRAVRAARLPAAARRPRAGNRSDHAARDARPRPRLAARSGHRRSCSSPSSSRRSGRSPTS